jgi:quercetin dioxygenase-like cupin family protein
VDDPGLEQCLSAFASVASLPPQQIWEGVLGRANHGERVTFSIVELDADCVIPEHSHENEQVGMLVAGSLTFRVGAETQELAPGATWAIKSNTPHEVRTGQEGAVAIEVFTPCRNDWQDLESGEPTQPRWPADTGAS